MAARLCRIKLGGFPKQTVKQVKKLNVMHLFDAADSVKQRVKARHGKPQIRINNFR